MAAGGIAPMSTSRTIPPAVAATKDNTSTPKRSILCFTPGYCPADCENEGPDQIEHLQKLTCKYVFVNGHKSYDISQA